MDMSNVINELRSNAQERLDNRRYMVRVITACGVTGFVSKHVNDVEPCKRNAQRFISLKNAIVARDFASRVHKSAWVVFDEEV